MPYFSLRKQSDQHHERACCSPLVPSPIPASFGDLSMVEIQTTSASSPHDLWVHGASYEPVMLISETARPIYTSRRYGTLSRSESHRGATFIVDSAVADTWLQMGENDKGISECCSTQTSTAQSLSPMETRTERKSSSSPKSQSIFRRTSQWWKTSPCLEAGPTEDSATCPTTKAISSWLRKGRGKNHQSRLPSSRSQKGIFATESQKTPTTPTWHSNSNSNKSSSRPSLQTVSEPSNLSFRRVNQEESEVNNQKSERRAYRGQPPSVVASKKRQNQQRDQASISRHNNRKSSTTAMTGVNCKWKSTVDPKSGKTYYYHVETKETQWRKPIELASEAEREAMEEKERSQRNFFSAMEANILRNLQEGKYSSQSPAGNNVFSKNASNQAEIDDDLDAEPLATGSTNEAAVKGQREKKNSDLLKRPDLVRTISSMDERILTDLVMRVPSYRNVLIGEIENPPTDAAPTGAASNSLECEQSTGSLKDVEAMIQPPSLARPNGVRCRQPSVGTLLASLPEEIEHSMESFGDFSMSNMGLSEQESRALISFAEASTQMALLGDDSLEDELGLGIMPLNEEDEQESSEVIEEPSRSIKQEETGDLLENMDSEPSLRGSMTRGSASHRVLADRSERMERPDMSRRNTCGTLYVGSTLSQPDIDATIKCVCGVIRAHILQSEMDDYCLSEFEVFNDRKSQQGCASGFQLSSSPDDRPTLDQITAFYRDVFQRAQMESDCIIMSLIYVERLVKSTEGKLRPDATNWRSLLFSCLVLASKVWDDLSMWNGDFSQTCPAGMKFSLQRINELELAVLAALGYKVKVPASEYAKYYFLLRAMLIKSGLGSDSMKELTPLDVEGAKRLQQVSSKFEFSNILRQAGNYTTAPGKRCKSLTMPTSKGLDQKPDGGTTFEQRKGKVSLEHMVPM